MCEDSPSAGVGNRVKPYKSERSERFQKKIYMFKTQVPIVIHVRCVEDNISYSIYKLDSSSSLDEISAEIIHVLESHYGYMYKYMHYDVYTDFDFTQNRYIT